jgi:hypothetical protein
VNHHRFVSLRALRSLLAVLSAVLFMGQMNNCADPRLVTQMDEFFGRVDQRANATVYVSTLPFFEVQQTGRDEALRVTIDSTVNQALATLAAKHPRYVINAPGHTPLNDTENALRLNKLYWDANLLASEKRDKIIEEIMEPAGIDGLVAGQFNKLQDGSVNVRLIAVSKPTRKIMTQSHIFKKEELECRDASDPAKSFICPKVIEQLIEDEIYRDRSPRL